MMQPRCRTCRREGGFTLIELLTAITILILIVLITSSLTLNVLSGSNSVQHRAESDTQGLGFMARIAYDLQTIVHNQNVPLVALPSSSTAINPTIYFVCASRSANRGGVAPRLSVVEYQIAAPPGDTQVSLLRESASIFWDATDGTPFDPSNALGLLSTTGSPYTGFTATPDLVPIGAGIIRITYVLNLTNGQTIPLSTSAAGFPVLTTFTSTPSVPSTMTAVDLSQVRAITVGIAVLDSASQRVAGSGLQNLVNAMPEPAAGQKPLDIWSVQNSSIQAALSGMPAPVRTGLRFYQQTVLVP